MKIMNWESVEESTPFEKLPAGGYVVRITAVEDMPDKEYLKVVYDIKEGPHAGFFSDDFARRNPWTHTLSRSYKESAQGMFKAFLSRLEESNAGFNVGEWQTFCNEQQLVGLELGLVLQIERYTNDRGEDRERLTDMGVYASQDIRNGDFKLPEVRDNRTDVSAVSNPTLTTVPLVQRNMAPGQALAPTQSLAPAQAYGTPQRCVAQPQPGAASVATVAYADEIPF